MTREPANRCGFTLIELLVVIAVFTVLMSILVPSIAAARRVAKRTACLTHLHSWGLGFQMYGQDNDNWMCFQQLKNPNATFTVYQWYMWYGYPR